MPSFSIVIPTYNRADRVSRAVESGLAQSLPPMEIIVVDDGSKDETEAVVRSYADRGVRYVAQENAGAAAARNRGIDLASGDHVAFLDSDDEFLPGKLAAFDAAIRQAGTPQDVVWYAPLLFYRGPGTGMVKPPRGIRPDEAVGDYLFADEGIMQTSTLVAPTELLRRVRFDPSLPNLQDLDLCLRLEAAGASFRMLPEPLTIWHDTEIAGRVSIATGAPQVESWLASRQHLLSERARRGAAARYLAPRLASSSALRTAGLVASAARHRAISPARAAMILARGVAPGPYAWMRDRAVSLLASRRGPD